MGVNMLALINNIERTDAIVNLINQRYGASGEDPDDALIDWCGLFEGEGGHLLTPEQALELCTDENSTPHYLFKELGEPNELGEPDGTFSYISEPARKSKDWAAELKGHNGPILFIKVRE